MQNGVLMHTLNGENQLKPRSYGPPEPLKLNSDKDQARVDPFKYIESAEPQDLGDEIEKHLNEDGQDESKMVKHLAKRATKKIEDSFRERAETIDEYKWATDTDMRQTNRKELPTFDPLQYQGITMTEATIGGFRLDMNVAQKKAMKFIPLPPVFLPIIFVDKNLNFSHHFFQGMDLLLGKDYMEHVVTSGTYSERDKDRLLPEIKALIMAGSKESDTELTIFVKRILSGTFDTLPNAEVNSDHDELIVAVNLWGFQYLEPSMRCKDADLKMWLHMSYLKYKVSWFNAFKSSGVPRFAMTGVFGKTEKPQMEKVHRKYSDEEIPRSKERSRRSRASDRERYIDTVNHTALIPAQKSRGRSFFG